MSADYSCAICLDSATDPVVTKCGHLYCWPCLDQWLARQPECPTCKGAIDSEKAGDIIPLYGKGRQSDNKSKGPNTTSADGSTSATTSEPGVSSSSAASASPGSAADSPQQPEGEHGFNTRHQRPRAQRETPNPNNNARRGGMNHQGGVRWGNTSPWGLCVVGAPTLLGDLSMLPIIIIVCVAAYYLYKYWQSRGRAQQQAHNNNNNNAAAGGVGADGVNVAGNHQAHPQQPAGTDFSFLPAIFVVGLAIFSIFSTVIAVDEEI